MYHNQLVNKGHVLTFLSMIWQEGSVYELRCLKAGRQKTISGYFDNPAKLAQAACDLSGQVPAIYCTLNPVNPALIARAANRAKPYAEYATSDSDIVRRHLLLIDADPKRPAGISSTDEEKRLALEKIKDVVSWLTRDFSFPEPIIADSGNGCHAVYAIDLPNDNESSTLLAELLKAVKAKWDDDKVGIDEKVFNAARIDKVYGTYVMKGDDTDDRPHRLSGLLSTPKKLEIVEREKLVKVITGGNGEPKQLLDKAMFSPPPVGADSVAASIKFMQDILAGANLAVVNEKEDNGKYARRWVLAKCPFCECEDKSAMLSVNSQGKLGFGCQHNRCMDLTWRDFKKKFGLIRGGKSTGSLTELNVARMCREYFGDHIKYNARMNGWFVWDGTCFVQNGEPLVLEKVTQLISKLQREASEIEDEEKRKERLAALAKYEGWVKLSNVLQIVKRSTGIVAHEDDFDNEPWVFNTETGWVDLITGEFHKHDKPLMATHKSKVIFNADAKCPLWEKTLKDYEFDKELIDWINRLVGACLSGQYEKMVAFFYGTGDNGKTLIFNILQSLLGSYAKTIPIESLLPKNRTGVPADLAELKGARLVCTSETPDGCRMNEQMIKWMTGGGEIKARYMRENFFGYMPQFKFLIDGNHKPNISRDPAIWNRMRILPFEKTFPKDSPECNPKLESQLKMELPGILNWAIKGCLQYLKVGLGECPYVTDATQAYRQESDEIKRFIDDCLELTGSPHDVIDKGLMYEIFKSWCHHEGVKFNVMAKNPFSTALRGEKLNEARVGKTQTRVWIGVKPTDLFDTLKPLPSNFSTFDTGTAAALAALTRNAGLTEEQRIAEDIFSRGKPV